MLLSKIKGIVNGRVITKDSKTKDCVIGDWEVEIIDGTHLKMRLVGTERWTSALHFQQVSDEIMTGLKAKGLVQGNFFKSYDSKTKDERKESFTDPQSWKSVLRVMDLNFRLGASDDIWLALDPNDGDVKGEFILSKNKGYIVLDSKTKDNKSEEAYDDGYKAGKEGKGINANPYMDASKPGYADLHDSWQDGWKSGKLDSKTNDADRFAKLREVNQRWMAKREELKNKYRQKGFDPDDVRNDPRTPSKLHQEFKNEFQKLTEEWSAEANAAEKNTGDSFTGIDSIKAELKEAEGDLARAKAKGDAAWIRESSGYVAELKKELANWSKNNDSKTKDAQFFKGDTVVANTSSQGMVKGEKYVVVEVEQEHTAFGNFVTYVIEGNGKELAIVNGHLLLNKGNNDADFKEEDHPREGGKFTSKGGGGSKSESSKEERPESESELTGLKHLDKSIHPVYEQMVQKFKEADKLSDKMEIKYDEKIEKEIDKLNSQGLSIFTEACKKVYGNNVFVEADVDAIYITPKGKKTIELPLPSNR